MPQFISFALSDIVTGANKSQNSVTLQYDPKYTSDDLPFVLSFEVNNKWYSSNGANFQLLRFLHKHPEFRTAFLTLATKLRNYLLPKYWEDPERTAHVEALDTFVSKVKKPLSLTDLALTNLHYKHILHLADSSTTPPIVKQKAQEHKKHISSLGLSMYVRT